MTSSAPLVIDGWDLTEAAEQFAPKPATAPKVAPAQPKPIKLSRHERIALHLSLHEAVKNKNAEEVDRLLAEGAPVVLLNSRVAVDMTRTAVLNFEPRILDTILANGGQIGSTDLYQVIDGGHKEALHYLLERQGQWPVDALTQKNLDKQIAQATSEGYSPQSAMWANNYQALYREVRSATDATQRMTTARLLEEKFPDLLPTTFAGPKTNSSAGRAHQPGTMASAFITLLFYANADHTHRFATTVSDEAVWAKACAEVMERLSSRYSPLDMTPEVLVHLHSVLSQYPHIKAGWMTANTANARSYERVQAFYQGRMGEAPAINAWMNTPVFEQTREGLTRLSKAASNVMLGWTTLRLAMACRQTVSQMTYTTGTESINRSVKDTAHRARLERLPKAPEPSAPSFTALLLTNGATGLRLVAATESGRAAIRREMRDPVTAHQFARNASGPVFNTVVRAIPELIEWRDDCGNTLVHHRVHSGNANKTMVEQLCAIDVEWLLAPNAQGFTARDVIKSPAGGASASVLAHLDSKVMNKTVRQSADVAKKTRAALPKDQRRRM